MLALTWQLALLPRPVAAQAPLGVRFIDIQPLEDALPGLTFDVQVVAENTGSTTWTNAAQFHLSYHWLDADGQVVIWDGLRTRLSGDIAPGEHLDLSMSVLAPETPGALILQVDMVQEGYAWFSDLEGNEPTFVSITVADVPFVAGLPSRPDRVYWGVFGRMAILLAALSAHFALWVVWLRRWMPIARREERVFDIVLAATASLFLVLQALLFSVGLGYGRVLLGLGLCHGLCALLSPWLPRARAPQAQHASVRRRPACPRWQSLLRAAASSAGASLGVGLLLVWAFHSVRYYDYTGTDVTYYHLPHALSFMQGRTPWGLLPTSHPYPMGTNVLAAALMLPTRSPLLCQFTNAVFVVLLTAATASILHDVAHVDGWAWAPWVTLLLVHSPLIGGSLTMSADLAYAACTVAQFALLWRIWRRKRAASGDILLIAAGGGLLLATKSLALLTLGLMWGLALAALGAQRLRRRLPLRWSRRQALVSIGATLLVAALGGLWLIRNWVDWGSPIAPRQLGLLDHLPPTVGGKAQPPPLLSVYSDQQSLPGYDYTARFIHYARHWFGDWLAALPIVAALVGMLDLATLARRQQMRQALRLLGPRLELLLLLLLLAIPHLIVFPGLPWSSLERGSGVALRYLMPWVVLGAVMAVSCAFPATARERPLPVGPLLLILLAAIYKTTGQSLGASPALLQMPVAASGAIALALAVCLGWALWLLGAARPAIRHGIWPIGLALVLALANTASQAQIREHARETTRLADLAARYQETGRSPSPQRTLYLLARDHQAACGQGDAPLRFYYDTYVRFPLQFQDASFRTTSLDLLVLGYEPSGVLGHARPLLAFADLPATPCSDFVVAAMEPEELSVLPELVTFLAAQSLTLAPVGQAQPFELWAVQPAP